MLETIFQSCVLWKRLGNQSSHRKKQKQNSCQLFSRFDCCVNRECMAEYSPCTYSRVSFPYTIIPLSSLSLSLSLHWAPSMRVICYKHVANGSIFRICPNFYCSRYTIIWKGRGWRASEIQIAITMAFISLFFSTILAQATGSKLSRETIIIKKQK